MLIRLLRERLLPYRGLLLAVVGLQAVQSMCTLYLPSITADIIDKGIIAGDRDYIWARGGFMLAVTVVQVLFYVAAVYAGAKAAMSFGRDVRHDLFHRVTAFSAREVAHHGAPSLITRITNDVQQVQMFVLMGCTLFVSAPITAAGGIFMATREDAPLSLILLVSVPALIIPVGIIVSRMIPQFRIVQDRIDRVNQVLREQITGIRVIRAFVREPDETARFEQVNDELTGASLHASHLMAFMFPTVMIVLNLSSIAAIWFGGARIDSGDMKIGALVAFISYLVQILVSVMMATFMVVMAPRAAVSAERIQEVLDTEPTVRDPDGPVAVTAAGGDLVLDGVGFHYPGAEQPVLSDVSFVAAPGTTTAIIGSTGAGKTTLLNVIPRLYDVTSGSVTIGGVDVRDMGTEDLWWRIGLVPQKPYLFSGTVRSNLVFANPDATDEDLWAALTVAQAADFVRAMPNGLDSPITQGGTNVSGGQRQRLAIARALVRKPDVYLFDDTFSALDLTTDARLRAALAPWTRDAAVIIVAQRVSTITSADQIVVLEDGQVVGLGSHTELLESCPTYVEIVESQVQQRGDAA
ncbi:MAG: ABC transporter ATP-binding protein [Acidimicrobiales bacterium]|nr:ABC transporter ATP-binding protein [Acidimicrobiales bacterium]